jgi:hypothetical protein
MLFATWIGGCTAGSEKTAEVPKPVVNEKSIKDLRLPSGAEGSGAGAEEKPALPPADLSYAEGSGGVGARLEDKGHPQVAGAEKKEREVFIPDDVKGKWKAVKLLVKNKKDETRNEFKIVELGKNFTLANGTITVSVGPFFPNFVMSENRYSSMNNSPINPAVQLVVEEKGKVIYKGWTFERYPTLYAFEHETYGLQLVDFIPADVS